MASEPTRPDLTAWAHHGLYRRVRDALAAVPAQFATEIFISGVLATDLHTLNSALGAAIEEQVVATLNAMRATWDADAEAVAKFVSDSATGEIRDEIAAALGIPKADLVKILDRLIASGRIERSGFRSNSRGLRRFVYVAGKARDSL